jgi:sporulation protein YlmC with PRC-barrel domain
MLEFTQKLMINGYICPESSCALSVEVRRGMPIFSLEGLEVGQVAAVVLNGHQGRGTHLLLSRLPEIKGYWMVPVDLIAEVRGEAVRLSIPETAIEDLPRWHSI